MEVITVQELGYNLWKTHGTLRELASERPAWL